MQVGKKKHAFLLAFMLELAALYIFFMAGQDAKHVQNTAGQLKTEMERALFQPSAQRAIDRHFLAAK